MEDSKVMDEYMFISRDCDAFLLSVFVLSSVCQKQM